jgi:hypothetical protein
MLIGPPGPELFFYLLVFSAVIQPRIEPSLAQFEYGDQSDDDQHE